MICDHATKCGRRGRGVMCLLAVNHKCACHGGNKTRHCSVIDASVRCIPHRSYDAEGRAARLKCIRFLRFTRLMTANEYQREAMRVLAKGILQAMREARKGAKNG